MKWPNTPDGIIFIAGEYRCGGCGARAKAKEANRFLKRHPKLCSERKEFTKQLGRGTKSVDYDLVTGDVEDR